MWKQLTKHLKTFPSGVITGVGADGYPFSVRCVPTVDQTRRALWVDLPPGAPVQPGPAGLLCHSHDERLWNLRSFLVHGRLEKNEDGWLFIPIRFIAGEGLNGKLSLLVTLVHARRNARRYLARRGLRRPKIPWKDINRLRAESKSPRKNK
jgi:hypothetical protein